MESRYYLLDNSQHINVLEAQPLLHSLLLLREHLTSSRVDVHTDNRVLKSTLENSSRIFIAMLHLYGTRGDTKIWAKIISAHAKKCSRMKVSVAEGRWVRQTKKKKGGGAL